MVGRAVEVPPVLDPFEGGSQRCPRRDADRDVVQASLGGPPIGRAGIFRQFEQGCFRRTERGGPTRPPVESEADDVAVEGDRLRQGPDGERDAAEPCVDGEAIGGGHGESSPSTIIDRPPGDATPNP